MKFIRKLCEMWFVKMVIASMIDQRVNFSGKRRQGQRRVLKLRSLGCTFTIFLNIYQILKPNWMPQQNVMTYNE